MVILNTSVSFFQLLALLIFTDSAARRLLNLRSLDLTLLLLFLYAWCSKEIGFLWNSIGFGIAAAGMAWLAGSATGSLGIFSWTAVYRHFWVYAFFLSCYYGASTIDVEEEVPLFLTHGSIVDIENEIWPGFLLDEQMAVADWSWRQALDYSSLHLSIRYPVFPFGKPILSDHVERLVLFISMFCSFFILIHD